MDALNVLCVQLTRDLFAIVFVFLFTQYLLCDKWYFVDKNNHGEHIHQFEVCMTGIFTIYRSLIS